MPESGFFVAPVVAAALAEGRAVVALESTLLTHGLPRPGNLELGRTLESVIREGGAVPATVGVVSGTACVGLDAGQLRDLAERSDCVKAGRRDLAAVCAAGAWAGTTVGATAHLAARAGVRVFATGGPGGVHRGARDSWDESADLAVLARTPVVVVCAGVKSILDVGATLERLETLGVPVLGYRTERFPGFYLTDSGFPAPHRVDSPAEVAAVVRAAERLGTGDTGMVVAAPIPEARQMDRALHDSVLQTGLDRAEEEGVSGKSVTPYLLEHFHRETAGISVRINEELLLRNAALGAEIALALTRT